MIFLTGGNGLVGSFIARKLIKENHYVRALRRKESDLSLIADIADKIEWVEGDINDVLLLEKYMRGADAVVHSAAVVSFSAADRKKMFHTNVEGTANVVNAALNQKVPRLLYISSVAALGRRKNHETIDESVFWEESPYNTNYAVSKYQAELEVWRGVEEGLAAVIVNPSVVLGPGNWNMGSSQIFKYASEGNLFYPKGAMNFIDVRDVAEIAYRLLWEEQATGQRFILNAGTLPYKAVLGMMADAFDKKKPGLEAGPFLTGLVWRAEALRTFFTRTTPAVTRETARAAKHSFIYNNSKIKNFLNYSFIKPDETIKWACRELIKMNNV